MNSGLCGACDCPLKQPKFYRDDGFLLGNNLHYWYVRLGCGHVFHESCMGSRSCKTKACPICAVAYAEYERVHYFTSWKYFFHVHNWQFPKIKNYDKTCTICLDRWDQLTTPEDFASNNDIRAVKSCYYIKLDCGHTYHGNCLSKWLRQSNTCPYCRHKWQNLRESYRLMMITVKP